MLGKIVVLSRFQKRVITVRQLDNTVKTPNSQHGKSDTMLYTVTTVLRDQNVQIVNSDLRGRACVMALSEYCNFRAKIYVGPTIAWILT